MRDFVTDAIKLERNDNADPREHQEPDDRRDDADDCPQKG